MTIVVIYGSTRPNGNTEFLTEKAIAGLNVEKIYLREYSILQIEDHRHSTQGFSEVVDDFNKVIDRVLPHETLIFVTPIYWYSMSGIMKVFIDRWSQAMRDSNYPNFRKRISEKKAFVIAVGGDKPYIKGLPMIQQFQYIFDYFGASFEGYIIGKASKPNEMEFDEYALSSAEALKLKLQQHI